MSIFDTNAWNPEKEYKKGKEKNQKAIEMFEVQKKSIWAIKDTDGFKEIVRYWREEKRLAETELLKDYKPEALMAVQRDYKTAVKFLMFLENLLR